MRRKVILMISVLMLIFFSACSDESVSQNTSVDPSNAQPPSPIPTGEFSGVEPTEPIYTENVTLTSDGMISITELSTEDIRPWDDCYFSDGLCAVIDSNQKGGYINTRGEIVIPLEWDFVSNFSDGLAVVADKNPDDPLGFAITSYIINKDGTVVHEIEHDALATSWSSINDGLIWVRRREAMEFDTGFINTSGELIMPFRIGITGFLGNGLIPAYNGTAYGFIDITGADAIPFDYEMTGEFQNGIAPVHFGHRAGRHEMGLIDTDGYLLIRWSSVSPYTGNMPRNEGLIGLRLYDVEQFTTTTSDGMWTIGFIDKTGTMIVPLDSANPQIFEFDRVGFSSGYAAVMGLGDSQRWGYIDKFGSIVVPPEYSKATAFSEDGFALAYKVGKLYLLEIVN